MNDVRASEFINGFLLRNARHHFVSFSFHVFSLLAYGEKTFWNMVEFGKNSFSTVI
jgi:hypothetical protein